MSTISLEVMDYTFGRPAGGVPIVLSREVDTVWQVELAARTDEDGGLAAREIDVVRGRYRIELDLDGYFATMGVEPLVSSLDFCFRMIRPRERVRLLVAITSASSSACRLVHDAPPGAAGIDPP